MTTSAAQAGSPTQVTKRRSQLGPAGGARPLSWLHASSATTTMSASTASASRKCVITASGCRSSAIVMAPIGICATVEEERRERREPHAAREADDPARAEPGDERQRQADEGDHAVPELDERVESLLRVGLVAALRPVVAPEAGSGQPHERTRGDTRKSATQEASESRRNPPGESVRTRATAVTTSSSTTPEPGSTDPMRVSASPAAANVASSAAPRSRGSETSRPPAVCGSYASASSAGSASLSTCGPA